MNLNQFRTSAPSFYKSGTALELLSGPGIGKSSVMRQVAKDLSRVLQTPFGFVTQILSGMDPADVRGFLFPVKGDGKALDARFSRPSVFPAEWNIEVFVDGKLDPDWQGGVPKHGILFLDEFGQADHEVRKPMGQVLLEKQMGEYYLGDGWVVWAASNRVEDRAGVVKELTFLQNRRKVLHIQGEFTPWQEWAWREQVHPLIISFGKKFAGELFRDSVPDKPGPFMTPRSLVLLENDLVAMRTDEHSTLQLPDDHIALEVAEGWIGEGHAPQLMSHIRLANELPDLDDILKKPSETPVPQKIDAQFVLATMLAHHADKKVMAPMLTYVTRLAKDLGVLFVNAVAMRDPAALGCPEFVKWAQQNEEVAQAALY